MWTDFVYLYDSLADDMKPQPGLHFAIAQSSGRVFKNHVSSRLSEHKRIAPQRFYWGWISIIVMSVLIALIVFL